MSAGICIMNKNAIALAADSAVTIGPHLAIHNSANKLFALLAESMINITSLRRKVAIDNNIGTVGGPIDVGMITKGDGFIWIKRKHYFDQSYNPQYFYSHYMREGSVRNEHHE